MCRRGWWRCCSRPSPRRRAHTRCTSCRCAWRACVAHGSNPYFPCTFMAPACNYATYIHAAHTQQHPSSVPVHIIIINNNNNSRYLHAAHTQCAPAHINNNIINNNNSHPIPCRSRGGGASSTRCSRAACRRGGASSMPPPRCIPLVRLAVARGGVCTSGSRATASSDRRDSWSEVASYVRRAH